MDKSPLSEPGLPWIGQYILDAAGNPVPATNLLEWAEWFEISDNRKVAFDDLGVLGSVSTIFLGLDCSFNPMCDPLTYHPVLWETMVFGGWRDRHIWRYDSVEKAKRGHARMVELVKEGPPPCEP